MIVAGGNLGMVFATTEFFSVEVLSLRTGIWNVAENLDAAVILPVLLPKDDTLGLLFVGGKEYLFTDDAVIFRPNSRVREFRCWNGECAWKSVPADFTELKL